MAEFNATLRNALTFTTGVTCASVPAILAVIGLLAVVRPSSVFVQEPWVICLLAFQVVGAIPLGLLNGVYRTQGDFAKGQVISALERGLIIAAVAFAISAGASFKGAALAYLLPMIVAGVYVVRDVHRRYPSVEIGLVRLELKEVRSWIGPSSLFLSIQLLTAILFQGSILAVRWKLGLAAVAVFATTRTMANLIRSGTALFRNSVWPGLTAAEARGDLDQVRRVHLKITLLTICISCASSAFLYLCGSDILRIWTRGKIAYDSGLMALLLLGGILEALWGGSSAILMAINRHRLVATSMVLSIGIGLPLGIFLAGRIGLKGMAAGLLFGDIVSCAWVVPAAACRFLGESVLRHFARILMYLVFVLACQFTLLRWVVAVTAAYSAYVRIAAVGSAVALLSAAIVLASLGRNSTRVARKTNF